MGEQLTARNSMIEGQIRPNEVTDPRIIEAFGQVPRERFVPKALRGVAYLDEDIEIAPGRYLVEPVVMARLAQAADITDNDAVLDVGCATGYSSAILSKLAGAVVALEQDSELAAQATGLLSDLQYDNVIVAENTLIEGFEKQAPYDVIFINGMFDVLPKALEKQLAENGRLIGVGQVDGVGRAVIYTKTGGVIGRRELFDASVPLLPGFQIKPRFKF